MKRLFSAMTFGSMLLASTAASAAAAFTHHVPYGTPVQLRVDANLSSRDLHGGDLVPMRVLYNVVVDGYVVIARGAPAVAEVESSDGAQSGGMTGELMLKAVWARAVDHSRIGITGYLTGLGKPRDIAVAGNSLMSGAYVAESLGGYGLGVGLAGAGIAANGIASAQKGGEAYLTPQMRMNTEVQNLWGVSIDSNLAAGPTDDSPIK